MPTAQSGIRIARISRLLANLFSHPRVPLKIPCMSPPAVQSNFAALVPLPATSSRTTAVEAPAVADKEAPKPPPRIYSIYSWRAKAPTARLAYIRTHTIAEEEIAKFKPGLVGFDLEWRPTFVKGKPENPVSLVQLANEDTVLLLQVTAMQSESTVTLASLQVDLLSPAAEFPDGLRELLLDPAYVKAGVGIQSELLL